MAVGDVPTLVPTGRPASLDDATAASEGYAHNQIAVIAHWDCYQARKNPSS
jgi:hypothetical protein